MNKRTGPRPFGLAAAAAALIVLTACSVSGSSAPQGEAPGNGTSQTQTKTPDNRQAPTVEQAAQEAVKALKDRDMEKLAAMAHPSKGVRFSPYGYIDVKRDLVFRPDQIRKLMSDSTVYEWGFYDGSGEPIKLKFADYYGKFLFDADFTKPQKSATDQPIGKGTTKNNLTEVYSAPNHSFVEFHFEGIDPKLKGMDWRSLRLVFEKTGGKLVLVGIVHDQWTT